MNRSTVNLPSSLVITDNSVNVKGPNKNGNFLISSQSSSGSSSYYIHEYNPNTNTVLSKFLTRLGGGLNSAYYFYALDFVVLSYTNYALTYDFKTRTYTEYTMGGDPQYAGIIRETNGVIFLLYQASKYTYFVPLNFAYSSGFPYVQNAYRFS